MKKIFNFCLLGVILYLMHQSNLFTSFNVNILYSYHALQVIAIFFLSASAQHLMYLRWLRFLRQLGVESNHDLIRVWHHRSTLIGYFVLGFIASDALRVFDARKEAQNIDLGARILLSSQATILDRIFSLTSLCLVATLAIVSIVTKVGMNLAAAVWLIVIISLAPVIYYAIQFSKSRHNNVYLFNLLKLVKDQIRCQKNRSFMASQLGISMLGNFSMGCCFFLLSNAAYDLAPFSVSVLSLSNLTALIPLTPAGLGFAEGLSEHLMATKGILLGAEAMLMLRFVNLIVTVSLWTYSILTMRSKQ